MDNTDYRNANTEGQLESLHKSVSEKGLCILTNSEIDSRISETKIKMEDAVLSNGREELLHKNRKMKHYLKQKEHLKEGVNVAVTMKQPSATFSNDVKIRSNINNNIISKRPMSLSEFPRTPASHHTDTSPNYSELGSSISLADAKMKSVDSPISGNDETESLAVSEKIVKELEKTLLVSSSENSSVSDKEDKVEETFISDGFVLSASNNRIAIKENLESNMKKFSGECVVIIAVLYLLICE